MLAHVQIHADDRLHTARHRCAVELDHRKQVVLVGYADRRHPGGGHCLDQLVDAHHAIDE